MNRKGLIAKISNKYVLPTCIWKYFLQSSRYFAFFGEFRGISRKCLNFAGPRPREISEALHRALLWKWVKYSQTISLLTRRTDVLWVKLVNESMSQIWKNKRFGRNNKIKHYFYLNLSTCFIAACTCKAKFLTWNLNLGCLLAVFQAMPLLLRVCPEK